MKGNGAIRLGDFSLSPLMEKSCLKKETAMYMAPEVFRDEAVMKSDVWSLGVTQMSPRSLHSIGLLSFWTLKSTAW